MTEQPAPYRPNPTMKRIEDGFESLIFNSRWLMAPFYFGLVVSLAVLFRPAALCSSSLRHD